MPLHHPAYLVQCVTISSLLTLEIWFFNFVGMAGNSKMKRPAATGTVKGKVLKKPCGGPINETISKLKRGVSKVDLEEGDDGRMKDDGSEAPESDDGGDQHRDKAKVIFFVGFVSGDFCLFFTMLKHPFFFTTIWENMFWFTFSFRIVASLKSKFWGMGSRLSDDPFVSSFRWKSRKLAWSWFTAWGAPLW